VFQHRAVIGPVTGVSLALVASVAASACQFAAWTMAALEPEERLASTGRDLFHLAAVVILTSAFSSLGFDPALAFLAAGGLAAVQEALHHRQGRFTLAGLVTGVCGAALVTALPRLVVAGANLLASLV
jgi:hypothetical protein